MMVEIRNNPGLKKPWPGGFEVAKGWLSPTTQSDLLREVFHILDHAPPWRPSMPRTGQPLSVLMSNCGPLGWISDRAGYRYEAKHPETDQPWPPIPALLLECWAALTDWSEPPDACLINLYGPR